MSHTLVKPGWLVLRVFQPIIMISIAHALQATAGAGRKLHQPQTAAALPLQAPVLTCQPVQQRARSQAAARQDAENKPPNPEGEVVLCSADSIDGVSEQELYPH